MLLCAITFLSYGQVVEIESTNDAVLLPRVDTLPLIANAKEGMIVYQKSDPKGFYVHDGNEWKRLKSSHITSTRTQIAMLGNSNITGEEATQEANVIIGNAAVSGCRAISIGGYAAALSLGEFGGSLEYGIPILLDCPAGTMLNANGTPK